MIRLYRIERGGGAAEIVRQIESGGTLGIEIPRATRRGSMLRLLDPLFRLCHEEAVPGGGPGGFVFEFAPDALPGRYRVLLENGGIDALRELELLPGERRPDRLRLVQSVALSGRVDELELFLALPPVAALHQQVRELEPSRPAARSSDLAGNEWLRLGPLELRAPLEFGYRARLATRGFSVDPRALADPPQGDGSPAWLGAEAGIESDHPAIVELARGLPGESVAELASAAFVEVKRRIRYRVQRGEYGALAGLERGEGDCTEIAALFVALLRARGVPSRVVIGASAGSSELHAIAELRHRGLWIPADVTAHPEPFFGVPADLLYLLRANWMSCQAATKQLSYRYRATAPGALQVRERFTLEAEPRRRVAPADGAPAPAVRRVVELVAEGDGVTLSHRRSTALRGALYLCLDEAAPRILWSQPVRLPPGEPLRVALPPDRLQALPGPSGGLRAGFVDARESLVVETAVSPPADL